MIDWYNLIMNACWIFGCSVVLAALSYASWKASAKGEKLRTCVGQSSIQISINFGGFLFCVGLAGTSDVIWQRILWIILGLGFLIQVWGGLYRKTKIVEN